MICVKLIHGAGILKLYTLNLSRFFRELIFYGDERDRVGVDAKCRWAEVSFYYQEASGWWISRKR